MVAKYLPEVRLTLVRRVPLKESFNSLTTGVLAVNQKEAGLSDPAPSLAPAQNSSDLSTMTSDSQGNSSQYFTSSNPPQNISIANNHHAN